MTDAPSWFKEHFNSRKENIKDSFLYEEKKQAIQIFNILGIPSHKHEEWRGTPIASLIDKAVNESYAIGSEFENHSSVNIEDIRLSGRERVNELVFINGRYNPRLSNIISKEIKVLPFDEAMESNFGHIAQKCIESGTGNSKNKMMDAILALNHCMSEDEMFIYVPEGSKPAYPVYMYHICDNTKGPVLFQSRCFMFLGKGANLSLVKSYKTIGQAENIANHSLEIVLEEEAFLDYYKIQTDNSNSNQINHTNIRQIEKSIIRAFAVSLSGALIRNNIAVSMESPFSEAYLYGLYFLKGNTHVDNHIVIRHKDTNCNSHQLYKGILDDSSTGIFNGKIEVNSKAQKTNAFQSNRNLLLSPGATANSKPKLEIFADDVKCSHGSATGHLDSESLFYLQSRGISEKTAEAMLLKSFIGDVIKEIKLTSVQDYINNIIALRLKENK